MTPNGPRVPPRTCNLCGYRGEEVAWPIDGKMYCSGCSDFVATSRPRIMLHTEDETMKLTMSDDARAEARRLGFSDDAVASDPLKQSMIEGAVRSARRAKAAADSRRRSGRWARNSTSTRASIPSA